ncbi:transmembrane protein 186 [Pectinophora gossypiella]|uniref:transmembrane protein 186 n=1 Tax=Pectinophora gossypiella TaxID=13191 RepID=UPI00214EADC8|nr:transmembrane protein 186 [Pectinophora gossypiella]
MSLTLIRKAKCYKTLCRFYAVNGPTSQSVNTEQNPSNRFETVFTFDSVRFIALINRLKVYHLFGTSIAIPSCGLMEMSHVVSSGTFFCAAYVGITGAAVLSLATLPFRNVIGYLYISEDNKKIKISSVDYWGRRKDRIVDTEEWIPMLDGEPKLLDGLYLSPKLTDGTEYKLPITFGKVLNSRKMGEVLE